MADIRGRLNEIDRIFYHIGSTGRRSSNINIHMEMEIDGLSSEDIEKGYREFIKIEGKHFTDTEDGTADDPIINASAEERMRMITGSVGYGDHFIKAGVNTLKNGKVLLHITVPHFSGDSRVPCHVIERIMELAAGKVITSMDPDMVSFIDIYRENVKGSSARFRSIRKEIEEILLCTGIPRRSSNDLFLFNLYIDEERMKMISRARRKLNMARPEIIQSMIIHCLDRTFNKGGKQIHNVIFDIDSGRSSMNNMFRSVPLIARKGSLIETVETFRKVRDEQMEPESRYAFSLRARILTLIECGSIYRSLLPFVIGSVSHYVSYINLNSRFLRTWRDDLGIGLDGMWMNMRPVGSAISNVAICEYDGKARISVCLDRKKCPEDAERKFRIYFDEDMGSLGS